MQETSSGLWVSTRERAFPRDHPANVNPAIGTVGPNVPSGFGDTHVMYPGDDPPLQAEAWDGWPVEWDVPSNYNQATTGRAATVWICIDLNARIIGSMPVYVVKDELVVGHPSWIRNPAPGIYTSWAEAMEQIIWTYQLRGEAFLWALSRYADGTVQSFTVLNPDHIKVGRSDTGSYTYSIVDYFDPYEDIADDVFRDFYTGETFEAPLDPMDVLHISYSKWPGELRGHSALEAVYGHIKGIGALQKMNEDLATRGGIPWGVLSSEHQLTKDEVDRLRKQWTDAAARRDGAPAITSGGFTLETLTISPRDMMMLEALQWNEARIAIALGVQPYQVGLPQASGLTYANVASVYDYHWRAFLRPTTRKIAAAVSQWALPYGREMRFNPDQYVRPALELRVPAYEKLIELGVLTAEEVRLIEDFQGDAITSVNAKATQETSFG